MSSPQNVRSPAYRPDLYGESFADVYDDWYAEVSDAEACAAFVTKRCQTGPVLELGVGSGRLAFPLANRGVRTVGLDASILMLRQAGRVPNPNLELTLADMRRPPFRPSSFSGILIGFNTLFNVTSEREQQNLIVDLAALLTPDGYLIIEASNISAPEGPKPEASVHSFGADRTLSHGLVVTSTNVHERQQRIDGCHIQVDDAKITFRPWHLRWVTPDQLDSHSEAGGLTLSERYADWDLTPFTGHDSSHVSVYRRQRQPSNVGSQCPQ